MGSERLRAFLMDGRDDLLIVFSDPCPEKINPKKILKRIEDIYAIQDALYQDFMVDRTRLSFMPRALKIFEEKEASKDFKVIIRLRLKEDRTLSLSNHDKTLCNIKGLYKSPGQFDYEIDTTPYFTNGKCPNLLKIIDNIVDIPNIDYTETLILKKWGNS